MFSLCPHPDFHLGRSLGQDKVRKKRKEKKLTLDACFLRMQDARDGEELALEINLREALHVGG